MSNLYINGLCIQGLVHLILCLVHYVFRLSVICLSVHQVVYPFVYLSVYPCIHPRFLLAQYVKNQ